MALFSMETGKKAYQKDREFVSIRISHPMTAIGKKDSLTEWVRKLYRMELLSMDDGLKAKLEDMGLKFYRMGQCLRENGKNRGF